MENVQFFRASNDRLGGKINSLMRGAPLRLVLIRRVSAAVLSRDAVTQEETELMMVWRPAQRRFCWIRRK